MNYGVTMDEAISALANFAKIIPPLSEEDVDYVYMNPAISPINKLLIIRRIKKSLKKSSKRD